MIVQTVGVDPGQMSGVALVRARRGERPQLIRLWRVTGRGAGPWVDAATAVWRELGAQLLPDLPTRVWFEEPPPALGSATRKAGGLEGDRNGLRSWCGLGRYQGRHDVLARQQGLDPNLVEVSTWTKVWGVIERAKRNGGQHRVREAGMLVAGAQEALAALPETGRIDCAESVLIAGACALWSLGQAYEGGRG